MIVRVFGLGESEKKNRGSPKITTDCEEFSLGGKITEIRVGRNTWGRKGFDSGEPSMTLISNPFPKYRGSPVPGT